MSGRTVSRMLRNRFESIRQSEIGRLDKKLRGLTEEDRRMVESITADIIQAIACLPERALAADTAEPGMEALVRLFALECDPAATAHWD
jgi:glutamyl-tRNA reductase